MSWLSSVTDSLMPGSQTKRCSDETIISVFLFSFQWTRRRLEIRLSDACVDKDCVSSVIAHHAAHTTVSSRILLPVLGMMRLIGCILHSFIRSFGGGRADLGLGGKRVRLLSSGVYSHVRGYWIDSKTLHTVSYSFCSTVLYHSVPSLPPPHPARTL